MEINFQAGMASRFFVTDPKKGVVSLSNIYVIFSHMKLSNGFLAIIYEKIFNATLKKGLFGALLQKAEAQKIESFLDDLANGRKLYPVVGIPSEVLIISNGIEKQCLMAMKVLKLRGLSRPLAINVSSIKADDVISYLLNQLKEQVLYEDISVVVFKPSKKLHVVSNSHRTILSTENLDILKAHPELAVGLNDPGPIDQKYLLEEGNYN